MFRMVNSVVPVVVLLVGVGGASGGNAPATRPAGGGGAVDGRRELVAKQQRKLLVVGVALYRYAGEHGGMLPKTLGEALPYVRVPRDAEATDDTPSQRKARYFLIDGDWEGKPLPSPVTEAWVTANSPLVYLAGGLKMWDVKDAGSVAVLHVPWEKGMEVEHEGKAVKVYPVAFLDGHVEAEPREMMEKAVEKSKVVIAGAKK